MLAQPLAARPYVCGVDSDADKDVTMREEEICCLTLLLKDG